MPTPARPKPEKIGQYRAHKKATETANKKMEIELTNDSGQMRWLLSALDYHNLFHIRSRLVQVFHTDLFNLGLPDLIRHPFGSVLWFLYLYTLSGKDMHLLCAPFSESDVPMTAIGSF